MKERSADNMSGGFSILEIMVSFAIIAIVISGAAMADFGSQYWSSTTVAAREGLSYARVAMSDMQRSAAVDFYSVTSSPPALVSDSYWRQTDVVDASPCIKYASITVSWQMPRFPTSSVALGTMLGNNGEAIALGGDCALEYPQTWTTIPPASTVHLAGDPRSIDVLDDTAYIAEDEPSGLEIVKDGSVVGQLAPPAGEVYEAIDVAKDLATNKVYAYIAASSSALHIIDVSTPAAPHFVSSEMQGPGNTIGTRAVVFYDDSVYVTKDQHNSGAKMYLYDVRHPDAPSLIVAVPTTALNTTVDGMVVRNQYSATRGAQRRFAFLATTADSAELQILDVTDPASVTSIKCDVPGSYDGATSIALSGNTLFVGVYLQSGNKNLYAFDASDPYQKTPDGSYTICSPLASIDVKTQSGDQLSARHPDALRTAGNNLFVLTNNTTPARGELHIYLTGVVSGAFQFVSHYPLSVPSGSPAFVDADFGGDTNALYVITSRPNDYQLQIFK